MAKTRTRAGKPKSKQKPLEVRELEAIAGQMKTAPRMRLAPSMNKFAQVEATVMDRWIRVLGEIAGRLNESKGEG